MAKRKSSTATATRAVVVRERSAPQAINVRVAAPKPVKHHRRRSSSNGGGSGGGMDTELKTALGGYALAVIENSPMANSIPAAPVIGRKGTLALLAWWWGKTNPTVRLMSRGMLAVAAYELGGGKTSNQVQGVHGFVPGAAAVM